MARRFTPMTVSKEDSVIPWNVAGAPSPALLTKPSNGSVK
jgi:hypothetical protein